jgi:hypothetical protein
MPSRSRLTFEMISFGKLWLHLGMGRASCLSVHLSVIRSAQERPTAAALPSCLGMWLVHCCAPELPCHARPCSGSGCQAFNSREASPSISFARLKRHGFQEFYLVESCGDYDEFISINARAAMACKRLLTSEALDEAAGIDPPISLEELGVAASVGLSLRGRNGSV